MQKYTLARRKNIYVQKTPGNTKVRKKSKIRKFKLNVIKRTITPAKPVPVGVEAIVTAVFSRFPDPVDGLMKLLVLSRSVSAATAAANAWNERYAEPVTDA